MSTHSATFDFTDSVVLVTGGATGIGGAITRAFLSAGATVTITGRRADVLADFVRDAGTDKLVAHPADVSKRTDVDALVADVVERSGRLDVVVSNAAAFVPGDITDLADDDWEAMRSTNIDGLFYLLQATLPRLEETGGNFVAVSSVSGLAGDWGQAGYNATKGAVSNFVRSVALDWGRRGVRVNAVAPALTDTAAVAAVTGSDDLVQQFAHRTAIGRIGQPEDIAPAVVFLASDAAAYITGVVLPVDGGTTASTGQAHL